MLDITFERGTDKVAFLRDCKRLARRKHRRSWFIGLSDCGQFSLWRGMMRGNEWRYTHKEVRALVSIGARKAV